MRSLSFLASLFPFHHRLFRPRRNSAARLRTALLVPPWPRHPLAPPPAFACSLEPVARSRPSVSSLAPSARRSPPPFLLRAPSPCSPLDRRTEARASKGGGRVGEGSTPRDGGAVEVVVRPPVLVLNPRCRRIHVYLLFPCGFIAGGGTVEAGGEVRHARGADAPRVIKKARCVRCRPSMSRCVGRRAAGRMGGWLGGCVAWGRRRAAARAALEPAGPPWPRFRCSLAAPHIFFLFFYKSHLFNFSSL